MDIQSVEVLKGPQALFFGKNSPGGVISLNSVSPGQEFGGFVRGGFNFLDKQRYIEGAVTLPLTDALGIRVAARADDSRGYIRNLATPRVDQFRPAETIDSTGKW